MKYLLSKTEREGFQLEGFDGAELSLYGALRYRNSWKNKAG